MSTDNAGDGLRRVRIGDTVTITGTLRTVEALFPDDHRRFTLDVDMGAEHPATPDSEGVEYEWGVRWPDYALAYPDEEIARHEAAYSIRTDAVNPVLVRRRVGPWFTPDSAAADAGVGKVIGPDDDPIRRAVMSGDTYAKAESMAWVQSRLGNPADLEIEQMAAALMDAVLIPGPFAISKDHLAVLTADEARSAASRVLMSKEFADLLAAREPVPSVAATPDADDTTTDRSTS